MKTFAIHDSLNGRSIGKENFKIYYWETYTTVTGISQIMFICSKLPVQHISMTHTQ